MDTEKNPDEMTESELAKYYEDRMGDVSQWQKKPVKMRIRRGGRSTMFSLRLTSEEMETLQKAAQERDVTLSDFIRSASLKEAQGPAEEDGAVGEYRVVMLNKFMANLDSMAGAGEEMKRQFEELLLGVDPGATGSVMTQDEMMKRMGR